MNRSREPEADILPTLGALTRKLRALFDDRTQAYGLTEARARLLLRLSQNGPMTQSELADAMGVEPPTMVRLIDGMEATGAVRREVVPGDRRQRHVLLTEAAQAQAESVQALTDQLRSDVLQGIAPEDVAVTQRVLRQMLENVAKASQS
ncbi:MarR family transcriptional regulator [Paracoccus sp. TK19116]|uniref:MarR family transcriptional regulator n=1 Tax=Paracoccus albicereus TaxID=2922394 RepID=A0ABT1MQD3_9RHOB|nr:MarR family transcriptional regulator [Paracoccus albicereus]MCQ0970502.1 MarR family transcriptional regulator [Paracoccus albicereus]